MESSVWKKKETSKSNIRGSCSAIGFGYLANCSGSGRVGKVLPSMEKLQRGK